LGDVGYGGNSDGGSGCPKRFFFFVKHIFYYEWVDDGGFYFYVISLKMKNS